MKKPLRKRIADAIKVLKGEPLPIELAPMPKIIKTEQCKYETIAARCEYGHQYIYGPASKEVIRKAAEINLADELGQAMRRAGVIQFQEDGYDTALYARVRVLVPAEGD